MTKNRRSVFDMHCGFFVLCFVFAAVKALPIAQAQAFSTSSFFPIFSNAEKIPLTMGPAKNV